jgi:hypothetical protein
MFVDGTFKSVVPQTYQFLKVHLMPDQPQPMLIVPPDGGDGGPCFLSGTRIAAAEGSVCVEELSVGAMVLTVTGESRAVQWLGHRVIDCTRHPDPSQVWPYQVEAGAFADGQPERDLLLSLGHSIFVENSLIQVDHLVNGATIRQVPRERVEYWHVELDSHDVLLAEGLPAESYLDDGNRQFFDNGGTVVDAFPSLEPTRGAEACAPMVKDGPVLQRVKAALLERAKALGYRLTHDADLHVVADGKRIEPVLVSETRVEFTLPVASSIELRSRSFVPAQIDPASGDTRTLGVAVAGLEINGRSVALKAAGVIAGWHPPEQDAAGKPFCWTRGSERLPGKTQAVAIDLCHIGPHYWLTPAEPVTASLANTG